jgi:hypothetical protein
MIRPVMIMAAASTPIITPSEVEGKPLGEPGVVVTVVALVIVDGMV